MPDEEVCEVNYVQLTVDDEKMIALATASQYAGDVCKTWLEGIFNKPANAFGPKIGYTAHIKLESTRSGNSSYIMELAVVSSDYSLDLAEFGDAATSIRENIPSLLQAA